MKKPYEQAEIEVIFFEKEEVILMSGLNGDGNTEVEGPGEGDFWD